MFDLGWSKLVLIAIVALIVIGPKELPAVLRTVGQWMAKIRRMAAEFQTQFQDAMREAEMADLKQHIDQIHDAAKDISSTFNPTSFNPVETVRSEMQRAIEGTPAAPAAAATPVETAPAPSPAAETSGASASPAHEAGAPASAPEPAATPPTSEPERTGAKGAA